MSIETRKISIINWITRLNDEEIISKIESLQQAESDWWEELPEPIKDSIETGIQQADQEETTSHEKVMKEARAKYGL